MALSKPVPTTYGVTATYHNIGEVLWQKATGDVQLRIDSYLDAASRHGGAKPLASSGAVFKNQTDAPTLEEGYALLTASADYDWRDATSA